MQVEGIKCELVDSREPRRQIAPEIDLMAVTGISN